MNYCRIFRSMQKAFPTIDIIFCLSCVQEISCNCMSFEIQFNCTCAAVPQPVHFSWYFRKTSFTSFLHLKHCIMQFMFQGASKYLVAYNFVDTLPSSLKAHSCAYALMHLIQNGCLLIRVWGEKLRHQLQSLRSCFVFLFIGIIYELRCSS